MNSVTARALEVKKELDLLYKSAEEAVAKKEEPKEKPKYSYDPKPKNSNSTNPDDAILSGSGWATAGDVLGLPYSHARAGKATTLAKAMGNDVDLNISHPVTSNVIASLLTGGLGAGIGGLVGGTRGAITGGGIGAGVGGILNNMVRADDISKIRDDYNKARAQGKTMDLAAANPNLSRWGALLPFGGFHRAGSVDALEHLAGRPVRDQTGNVGRAAGVGSNISGGLSELVSHIGRPYGPDAALASNLLGTSTGLSLLSAVGGGMEGYNAAVRNQKLISDLDQERKLEQERKAAIDLEKGGSAGFAARLGYYNGTMHKRAFLETLKGLGNQALDTYKGLDPTAQAAILGGGGGAVLGGLGNALFGRRKPNVGILGRLGRGALAGGALGGLAGAGINEGALRLGMHGAGASDRGYHLAATRGASGYNGSQLPTNLANDYISGLANKIN